MKKCNILIAAISIASVLAGCKKEEHVSAAILPENARQTTLKEYSGWSVPVNMGPVINSNANEQHPFLSKDGLSLFFGSNRQGTAGQIDIWVSERESLDSPWGTPRNLGSNINSNADDFAAYLSPDEHRLYFHSARITPSSSGGVDLYVARRHNKRDNFEWEPAENLGPILNSSCDDAGPTYFEDENGQTVLYFTSTRPISGTGGCVDFNIWTSIVQPDGSFGPATYLPELSSPFRDTRTAIRRKDGLEIYISTERPGGPGTRNIWVATRESTSEAWSTPVIVPVINSTNSDGAPALSFDGKSLIFFSNRPGGSGANDLYISTRTDVH
jgi:Tol biopolymer transport system component